MFIHYRLAMKMISPLVSLTITTLVLISSSSTHANEATNPKPHFKNVYAFGDSYTDTGNTKSITVPGGFIYVSNPPYGRTYFGHPTNRFSDGRLVVDFLMESLSLPFLPPYLDRNSRRLHGVNFAVSASTAIEHSFFVKNKMPLAVIPQSLSTELEWFEGVLKGKGCVDSARTPRECEAEFNDALIWVGEMGANDYLYSIGSKVPTQTVQQLVIKSITDFLQALLKKGAKYIVVQGLPPTGCLSLSLSLAPPKDRDANGCVASANQLSFSHNAILKTKLDALRKEFPHSTIAYADYYNAYLNVLKNARRYGFNDVFGTCCGHAGNNPSLNYFLSCGSPISSTSCSDPSRSINWDGVHLTEAMYKVMAHSFLNGSFTQPRFSDLLANKRSSGN